MGKFSHQKEPIHRIQNNFNTIVMAIENSEICLTISDELMVMAEAGDLQASYQPAGLLDALIDPANAGLAEVDDAMARGGKTNKVFLRFIQPTSLSQIGDEVTNVCDETGVTTSYQFQEVEADLVAATPVYKFTMAEYRLLCEEGSQFRQKVMLGALNAIRRDINSKLITLFDAGAGKLDGVDNKEYVMLYKEGAITTALDDGMIEFQTDVMDTGATGMPIVVAGGNMHKWLRKQGIACCNSNGWDISQLGDVRAYYDNQIVTTLGPSAGSAFFAFAPGAAIFVGTDQYVDQFRMADNHVVLDTIIDPITGMTYDFELQFDKCDKVWKMQVSKKFGLYQLPKTLFKSGDERAGVNWNFSLVATEEEAA